MSLETLSGHTSLTLPALVTPLLSTPTMATMAVLKLILNDINEVNEDSRMSSKTNV